MEVGCIAIIGKEGAFENGNALLCTVALRKGDCDWQGL